jgi:hypothetical protein
MKYFIIVFFLLISVNTFSQFEEKKLDIGLGFHFCGDLFNSYDMLPVLDLRYNRNFLTLGPTIGYNKNELGDGGENVGFDGLILSYAFRINKNKKGIDVLARYCFITENYYLSYRSFNNQSLKYQENNITHALGFQVNFNFSQKVIFNLYVASGYRSFREELSNLDTQTKVDDSGYSPVILLHSGLTYNLMRLPKKSGKKVF